MRTNLVFGAIAARGLLMTGAIVVFTSTAAIAGNSPPIADNFQPFMWERPQVQGEPMTARGLGMEDRVNAPQPLHEGRAASTGSNQGAFVGYDALQRSFDCHPARLRIQGAWRDMEICD